MIRDGSSGSPPATRTSVEHETTQTTTKVPVTIEIGGTKLSIKTDRTLDSVTELAQYIDEKLDALTQAAPSVKKEKLLLMVSMTVAEELFETRQELTELKSSVQSIVGNCLKMIDDGETDFM